MALAGVAALADTTPGCGKKPMHTGLFKATALDGVKRVRTFQVQVPAQYNSSHPYPLIFVFHGAGGSSAQSYSWGLQNVAGASEAAIFVFPDGINFQNYGIGWDDSNHGYDIPFFDNMARGLEANFCVDTDGVFAAGFSWGGDFVTSLACNRGGTLRAVAVNSATDEFRNNTNHLTYQNLPCMGKTHPALRFEHASGGDSAYPAPLFATSSNLFRYLNACSAHSTSIKPSSSAMSCVSYNGCTEQYIECNFNPNIGHTLPPNWAKDTWAYFSGFQ